MSNHPRYIYTHNILISYEYYKIYYYSIYSIKLKKNKCTVYYPTIVYCMLTTIIIIYYLLAILIL